MSAVRHRSYAVHCPYREYLPIIKSCTTGAEFQHILILPLVELGEGGLRRACVLQRVSFIQHLFYVC